MTPSVPTDAGPAAGRPARSLVLVAAADPTVRAAVAAYLRHAGLCVVEASNGVTAVTACRALPGEFAAALTDVRLRPVSTGRGL